MKILFVTPELAPWSKAGGLGDATVALGKALAALGHDVRAVTPLYGSVPGREQMGTLIESLKVGVSGDPRRAACRVRTLAVSPGFEAWFIEHEDFYGAREIYPAREDAGERAAFFGRAGLDACLATSWIPDIVHCHDWTAGLVPVLLNTYYPPNQPTPGRCYRLGRAIRQAVETWPAGRRAALGLLLAWGGLAGIRAVYAGNHDTYESLTRMDLTVVLVTLGLSLAAGLAAGIYPAWRIGRTAPAVYLKSQ